MVWIFCPEMTLAQFPKSKFWNFCWIFCPEMTLAQFPEFGFFVQNSRIGVINMKYPLEKSSVSVKDASEIKKNENSAKVPVTKVQKKVGLMRECRNQF